jgi:hypothetical protein
MAQDIVGIRHKTTTGEDTADSEDLVRAVLNCDSAIISCSYDL